LAKKENVSERGEEGENQKEDQRSNLPDRQREEAFELRKVVRKNRKRAREGDGKCGLANGEKEARRCFRLETGKDMSKGTKRVTCQQVVKEKGGAKPQ